ncbi:MAG: hypothetical protein EOO48_06840, partial [Flavobacterium sp.]
MKKQYLLSIAALLLIIPAAVSQETKTISRDWTAFVQSINVESKSTKKFKLEGFIKVVSDDQNSNAGLWARVDNKDDSQGFVDYMEDRFVKASDWKSYTIEGTIDAKSKSLSFGGSCEFNGRFLFDNFKLFIENDKGVLELVPIQNNSFEQPLKSGSVAKWTP